jgi:hypothetical protein
VEGIKVATRTFPADWADIGCPPADAEDASGEVFRIAKNDPPTDEDFLSYHEMGITRGPEILRRGLSIARCRTLST